MICFNMHIYVIILCVIWYCSACGFIALQCQYCANKNKDTHLLCNMMWLNRWTQKGDWGCHLSHILYSVHSTNIKTQFFVLLFMSVCHIFLNIVQVNGLFSDRQSTCQSVPGEDAELQTASFNNDSLLPLVCKCMLCIVLCFVKYLAIYRLCILLPIFNIIKCVNDIL